MQRPPPHRHTELSLHVLAVALLVVLAGCNVPSVSGHSYPPGVNETGVQNATALANSHQDRLKQGYRAESSSTVVAENGTTLLEIQSTTRWSPSRANRTVDYSRSHPIVGVHAEIFANDTAVYLQKHAPGGNVTTHRLTDYRPSILVPGPDSEWEIIYAMAGTRNTTATALPNGTTRIRFRNAPMGRGTGDGTLYVTSSGLVTRYTVTYDSSWVGTPVTYHTRANYSHVEDPNVVKPDWVANVSEER